MSADPRALILVVERDPHARSHERIFLEDAGFSVAFADDGQRAIELARDLHPALVITEILLPRCDGLSLCRILKSNPETRETVVLIVSILAAADRAREVGADAYLRRPLNAGLLLDAVRKLMRSARAQRRGDGPH
jgi:two-component system response regulator MprA